MKKIQAISYQQSTINNSSFTLIELLLSIAIISVISTFSFSFYTRFLTQNALNTTVDQLVTSLRKAQMYSMTGKQNNNWGVNYSNNKVTLFKGTALGQDHSFDEVYNVNQNINLSGFTEVYFNRPNGSPSSPATIVITGNNDTEIIAINEQGIVSKL